MSKAGAIRISTYEYAIELSRGWVHLTRYLSECTRCPHQSVCKTWTADYTYSDCDYVALSINGCLLSDTYDFDKEITQEEYPEFSKDEVTILNEIITDHLRDTTY